MSREAAKSSLSRSLFTHNDTYAAGLAALDALPSAGATGGADAFKAYVHGRLDEAGIPTHPDGPHSKEGCRIGDRLDIALGATGPVGDEFTRFDNAVNALIARTVEVMSGKGSDGGTNDAHELVLTLYRTRHDCVPLDNK